MLEKFLEDPILPGQDIKQHTWWDLREHLATIGIDILHSASAKKFDFFQQMLFDENNEIVKLAFQILAYADDLPPKFFSKFTCSNI